MKVRQGFVSNSSSSSFLIIGKEIEIKDVTYKMVKEKNIIVAGDYLSDAQDIFKIKTIEEYAFIKALNKISIDDTFKYYNAYFYDNDEESEGEIDLSKLPNTGIVKYFYLEQDYKSSKNLDDMKRRYDEFGTTNAVMQRYLRAKKLKKIEKNSEIITNINKV